MAVTIALSTDNTGLASRAALCRVLRGASGTSRPSSTTIIGNLTAVAPQTISTSHLGVSHTNHGRRMLRRALDGGTMAR